MLGQSLVVHFVFRLTLAETLEVKHVSLGPSGFTAEYQAFALHFLLEQSYRLIIDGDMRSILVLKALHKFLKLLLFQMRLVQSVVATL